MISCSTLFDLITTDNRARRGRLKLNHGTVETPVFMSVATQAAIKSLSNTDLYQIDLPIILSNTYHLSLQDRLDIIDHHQGLHQFINWDRPILTDSGGFQIYSLASLNKITDQYVSFNSHIDGQLIKLTPERSTKIQEIIGSDIHMVLDQCIASNASYSHAKEAMERTINWADRCYRARSRLDLFQFSIAQGGMFNDLRIECIKRLIDQHHHSIAIGGLSVGEEKQQLYDLCELSCEHLPREKPRYLMGVGGPEDIVNCVKLGIDMFDCVMPTRNARNGCAFTAQGKINIKNLEHKYSDIPLDENCEGECCKKYSRSHLRYLLKSGELNVKRLLTIHNLRYYNNLMLRIRQAIEDKSFDQLHREITSIYK